MLKDSIVAVVTPFNNDLTVDYKAFERLVSFHLNNNTKGIVVVGTTGESATLTSEEKLKLLETAALVVKGKIPVIFNSGNNNTASSVKLTEEAEKKGANYILAVTPYYNKPTQEGIFQHFSAIASSTSLPVCLYNVPARTITNIEVETVIRLANIPNIVAIKDAVVDLNRPLLINQAIMNKEINKEFTQLGGEDSLTLAYRASSGAGVISVAANVAPKLCQNVHEHWNNGEYKLALLAHTKLLNLHSVMFCETNPAPAKYALFLMGKCSEEVRLPLVTLKEESKSLIKKVLVELQLI